jgi:hypothetical protein
MELLPDRQALFENGGVLRALLSSCYGFTPLDTPLIEAS